MPSALMMLATAAAVLAAAWLVARLWLRKRSGVPFSSEDRR